MKTGLCEDCSIKNSCWIAKERNVNVTICDKYTNPLTDKQRVERAKGEIEAVMNRLQTDSDMKPDRVLVFWSLLKDGWKCEISMK
jgi:NMD protein affecting ribosome stability and mRNA decay